MDKKKAVKDMMDKINKKYGPGTIGTIKEKKDELTLRFIKTPSAEINLMLDGGVVKGKIVEIMGESGSGKTSLALEIIAHNQKLNPDFMAGWFETAEGSFDFEYAKMLGVDTDRLVYVEQPESGAEKGLDAVRAMISSHALDMVVVNSVAGLAPAKEMEDDLEKANIALTARLMSKLMRVIGGIASKSGTTCVFINQMRTDVGKMFGDPNVTTGGRALAYYSTQRIRLSKYKVQAADPITEDEGIKVVCKVLKNRAARKNPFKTCEYFAIYGKGIDVVVELPTILEREGIIRKSGAWIYYEDDKGKPITVDKTEMKFGSKAKFSEWLKSSKAGVDYFVNLLNTIDVKGVSMTEDEVEALIKEELAIEQEESTIQGEE